MTALQVLAFTTHSLTLNLLPMTEKVNYWLYYKDVNLFDSVEFVGKVVLISLLSA